MAGKKYVMTAARKAALRKAQEKAWAMRRGQAQLKKIADEINKMSPEQVMKKAIEATKKEQARFSTFSQAHKQGARQIAQRRMWEGSNYWGPNR